MRTIGRKLSVQRVVILRIVWGVHMEYSSRIREHFPVRTADTRCYRPSLRCIRRILSLKWGCKGALWFEIIQTFSRTAPDLLQDRSMWQQILFTSTLDRSKAVRTRAFTHWEDDHYFRLSFNNQSEVEPNLEALECFMNDDVLYLRCRNETCWIAAEVCRRRSWCLDS